MRQRRHGNRKLGGRAERKLLDGLLRVERVGIGIHRLAHGQRGLCQAALDYLHARCHHAVLGRSRIDAQARGQRQVRLGYRHQLGAQLGAFGTLGLELPAYVEHPPPRERVQILFQRRDLVGLAGDALLWRVTEQHGFLLPNRWLIQAFVQYSTHPDPARLLARAQRNRTASRSRARTRGHVRERSRQPPAGRALPAPRPPTTRGAGPSPPSRACPR